MKIILHSFIKTASLNFLIIFNLFFKVLCKYRRTFYFGMNFKMPYAIILLLGFFLTQNINSQDINRVKKISDFASDVKDFLEGYAQSTGGNDFTYHCFRSDISECLLTRCTTGNMAIEWNTETVPINYKDEKVGFVWVAAIDLSSSGHIFDFYINNIRRFEIKSGASDNWEISGKNGGKLKYFGMKKELWGESQGYMALWVPKSWIIPGKPVSLKIVGHGEDSQCWIIVYKAKDANNYLQNSVKYNSWADITIEKGIGTSLLKFNVPISFAGKDLILNIGSKVYKIKISSLNNKGFASLFVNTKLLEGSSLMLKDEYDELLSVDSIYSEGESIKLSFKSLLKNNIKRIDENNMEINSIRSYYPKTVEALIKLSDSKLESGKIYLMNSSHQDIAWMDSPEKCIIERDTMLLTPLFKKALKDPGYRFDIEDALMLREYIHRHPDSKDMIGNLLLNGQISCGAAYNQPYEDMYSGEDLVRELYLGAKWLKKEFGYSPDIYFNEDVPGRTLQMPQILSKAGIKYMSISRIKPGVFKWYGPDGSYVTTYSQGHYGYAFPALHNGFGEAAEFIADTSLWWDKYYRADSKSKYIPLFSDNDMSPAEDYSGIINNWNKIKEVQKTLGKYSGIELPKIKMSLTSHFIYEFEKNGNLLPPIKGERPDVWLYIHGPTHQRAVEASREGDILLTAAEKFAASDAMIDNSFAKYPARQLERAWEEKIYPDHGWGGKNGDITDDLFKDKFIYAENAADKVLNSTLNDIASKIKLQHGKGIPVVVFNSLSWMRNDPAAFSINFKKNQAKNIKLINNNGVAIPVQFSNIKYYDDNSIKKAEVHFLAEGVPSIGYKTYYLKFSNEPVHPNKISFNGEYENNFYKIKFADGGLSSIFDKELGKELIYNKNFNAGEVFTMHSEGTGAGEFADIQQPDMQGFDREANYPSHWKISESGDVYVCFYNRQPIRNAVIEQKIFIYKNIKRIDFVINLLNYEGVLYREYRMALPLNMENSQISYEVPFGVVNVGKDEIEGAAGERYKTICKDIHPRSIENWIGASNNEYGVTLTSSVAVADYIDPTDSLFKNPVLQPLLLASRRSCHWQGNEYLQTGDHHFEFSITSHKPGWENGFRFGCQTNEKLMVIVDPETYGDASLPEQVSFFNCSNKNIIISTVKKAEDESAEIIRAYNISRKEAESQIKCFKPFISGNKTNLIEVVQKPLQLKNGTINYKFGKYSIETFMVK